MNVADKYAGELTERDVYAWREGGWYFAAIRDQVVARRYKPHGSHLSEAIFIFDEAWSPRKPKTMPEFQNVQWRCQGNPYRNQFGTSNRLIVPVSEEWVGKHPRCACLDSPNAAFDVICQIHDWTPTGDCLEER